MGSPYPRPEHACWWVCLMGLLLLPAVAFAGRLPPEDPSSRPPLKTVVTPENTEKSPRWVGEFIGIGGGVGVLAAEAPGMSLDVAVRGATLLQLIDIETTLRGGLIAGHQHLGLGVQLNVHPGFIAVVWRNWWGVLASGFHGYAGLGVNRYLGSLATFSLGKRLGVGLDLPLMSLERPGGLWLTGRVGWSWSGLDAVVHDEVGHDGHATVALSWRWYDAFR